MHVHLTRLHRLGSKNTSKTEQQLQNIKVNKKKKKKKKQQQQQQQQQQQHQQQKYTQTERFIKPPTDLYLCF